MAGTTAGSATWSDEDLAEVVRRELLLLQPEQRTRTDVVLALLHPDFLEFGASGRSWDALTVAESMRDAASRDATRVIDLMPARLADDVILLTYTARPPQRESLRSSVWLRESHRGWLLRFHQGTTRALP